MAYVNGTYTSNAGGVYKIRISEEKAGLSGVEEGVASVTDPNVEVIASQGGRKKFGIHARGVTFSRSVGVGDDKFKKYIFIPAATPTIQSDLLGEVSITYKEIAYSSPVAVEEK